MDEIEQKHAEVLDLGSMIHSPGWTNIVRPQLDSLLMSLLNALVYGGAKDLNGDPITNDELRARIKNINWILKWGPELDKWMAELEQLKVRQQEMDIEEKPAGSIHAEDVEFGDA